MGLSNYRDFTKAKFSLDLYYTELLYLCVYVHMTSSMVICVIIAVGMCVVQVMIMNHLNSLLTTF